MYNVTESWGYALGKVTQTMTEEVSNHLAKCNINARDYGILCTIHSTPNLTQKQIGEIMKVDRTTMVQLIDALESKELVTRISNPNDRRQNLIVITESGQRILKEMWNELKECELNTIKNLSKYQKEAIIQIATILEDRNEKY